MALMLACRPLLSSFAIPILRSEVKRSCPRPTASRSLLAAYDSPRELNRFYYSQTYGSFAGFAPTVDGVTLTDTLSRLFQQGKFVKIPTLVGAVNDEGAQSPIRNQTAIMPSANGIWNLSSSRLDQAISYYAVNTTFGSSAPDSEGYPRGASDVRLICFCLQISSCRTSRQLYRA